LLDVGGEVGRSVIDASPFPTLILCKAGRVHDANRAACIYFGQTRESFRGTDTLGIRGYSPTRRAEYAKRFEAWAAGELVPFLTAWPPRTGTDRFLALPQGMVAFSGESAVMLALVPAGIIEAALAGEAAESAELARAWAKRQTTNTVAPEGDPGLAGLTPREWEIARRLAEGDRVQLMVEDLGIAENTVRNHLKSIFRKLRVASQAQLVRRIRPQLQGPKRVSGGYRGEGRG
jgi:DNA-binding CsgD family transcriptional regulator